MNKFKKYIVFGFLIVIIVAGIYILNSPMNNPLENDPYVLVIGDFSKNKFGDIVVQGISLAKQKLGSNLIFKTKEVKLSEPPLENYLNSSLGDLELSNSTNLIASRIIREVSDHNVVAIICAASSLTTESVLYLARTFSIPTLITVSTNNRILSDYSKIAFRLIATDSLQANILSSWCSSVTKNSHLDSTRNSNNVIAVLYDPRQYGIDLLEQLRVSSGKMRIAPFPIGTTTETVGIIKYAQQMPILAWLHIGYQHQAMDFFLKKKSLGATGKILFSDGAFGSWIGELNDDSIDIAFPKITDSLIIDRKSYFLPGYAVYGFDAIYIINECLRQTISENGLRKDLIENIRQFKSDMTTNNNIGVLNEYDFENGENIKANFKIYSSRELHFPNDIFEK